MAQTMTSRRANDPEGTGLLWTLVGAVSFLALGLAIAAFFYPTGSASGPGVATMKAGGPKRVSVKLTEFAIKPSTIVVASSVVRVWSKRTNSAISHFDV